MPNKTSTPTAESQALVVRLSRKTMTRVDRAAKARGLKRSEFVRQVLESSIDAGGDIAAEARRQSLLVSRSKSEQEYAKFLAAVTSTEGWQ